VARLRRFVTGSMLRTGSAVELLSLAGLALGNLVLPLAMGRVSYSTYSTILARALIPVAAVGVPADIAFLRAVRERAESLELGDGYMLCKIGATLLVCVPICLLSGASFRVLLAASAMALGLSSLAAVLHQAYGARAARTALLAGLGMFFAQFGVAIALSRSASPETIAIASGVIAAGTALLVRLTERRPLQSPQVGEASRLIVAGLRSQAWPSYLNSVVQWIAVLRIASVAPGLAGATKLSYSILNAPQALIPLSGAVVLAAGERGSPEWLPLLRRLWKWVAMAGFVLAVGIRFGEPVVSHVYGKQFPELAEHLALVAAGAAVMPVYWVFWPVAATDRSGRLGTRVLTAIAIGTGGALAVGAVSVSNALGIYVAGVSLAACTASLQAGVGWLAALTLIGPAVLAFARL